MRQNVLDKYPSAKLRVYAVWMPMLPTDARSEWDATLLDDRRVRHFWDEDTVLGTWLANPRNANLGYPGSIVWDAYVLFGPDARWGDVRTQVAGFGSPLIGRTGALAAELEPYVTAG